MICRHCRDHHHHNCPGGTWCDCQHQPTTPPAGDEQAEADENGPPHIPGTSGADFAAACETFARAVRPDNDEETR